MKIKKLKKSERKELARIGEYLVGGGLWFWSGYIIIVVTDDFIPLFWANFLGNGVGLTLNFLVQRYWAFKTKNPKPIGETTARYVVYTALNAFLLNYFILESLRSVGIEPEIGQFIASAFFTVWNYFWYRTWIFKGKTKPRHVRYHTH